MIDHGSSVLDANLEDDPRWQRESTAHSGWKMIQDGRGQGHSCLVHVGLTDLLFSQVSRDMERQPRAAHCQP